MTLLLVLCVASALLLLLPTRAQQKSFNAQCRECQVGGRFWCMVDCAADAEGGERFCAKEITCDPMEDASDSPPSRTRACEAEPIFTDDVPFKPKCPRLAARPTTAGPISPGGPSSRPTLPSTPADEDATVGIVIGSVIGGVLLLGICIGAFVFLALKRKKAPAPTNVAVNVQQQTTTPVSESDESESAKTPQYVEQVAASSSESEEKPTPAPVRSNSSSSSASGRNKKKKKTSGDEDSKYAKQIGAESSSSGPPD